MNDRWKLAASGSIKMAKSQWRAIRDEYRNFLMTQECAKMAQMVADLA